jgi:sphingomyelin phosphodiesterase acid-like 3
MARPASFFIRLCVLVVLGMAGLSTRAAGENGGFAVISDIHFDPFAPKDQATSRVGEDTNRALLTSGLGAFARLMAVADFAIVPGDFLTHGFNAKAAASLGVDPSSPAVDDVAAKTTLFVADALAGALGGKPAFVALGNEDSKCGDYKIEPGGAYLAATREAVRRLVGAERLEPDFAETWTAAGYYAARHPTLANGLIVVLNDVVWSPQYRDACGSNGLAAAQAMMGWLS